MMTLRTLKKRSKQALPILQKHFPDSLGEVFLAQRGENYHGLVIRCTHGAGDPCRVKGRPRCECSYHPLPGTPMSGGMSGYYEPEWDEHTVYEVLREVLWWTDKPDTMTNAEWAAALRIVRMTPASHADRMANFEREMAAEWGAEDEADQEAA
ncbi:MAG: hypothetical protein CL858_29460 [Cupriavidus sp.]|jgi:hypothetical protein|uniref:hypothetical protein n=1 Tax=Methylobacterium sp. TaxID=409 RepID=UPI000C4A46E5|nr:hypothetical protein [Methylobacterium sp.]MBP27888.1 hypothetical protein [Methylobacterium sp.]MBU69507.1 hypothetical protein [Cupriavidus sp.]